MREFESFTKSEIKKVNKAGNGRIGEYYVEKSEVDGFVDVTCSVFDNEFENIVATVKLIVCLFDRRRSWIASIKNN
jgi:hypothetical protein